MDSTKNTESKANIVPRVDITSATRGINAALDQLHLGVADSANVDEGTAPVKTSTEKSSFIQTAVDPPPNGPPPLMNMKFHYSQMMNLPPHQQASFLPMPEFHPPNGNNFNMAHPNKGVTPPMDSNNEILVFQNIPGPDGNSLAPYNMIPLPQLIPPLNDPNMVPD